VSVRLAIFAPALVTGGTQRHIQQLVRGLDRSKFRVVVYALRPGGEVAEELEASGVEVRILSSGERFVSFGTARAVARAARELRRDGVQIVHAYQWRPGLVGAIAGRLARVPVVLASKRSLSGSVASERRGWRVIGHFVDRIVVNAEALRVEAVAHGVRARWALVRNGIDIEHFRAGPTTPESARRLLDLPDTRPIVGSIGRLEARKGHGDLLQALARLRTRASGPPLLLLVGDGPERSSLERLAIDLNVADSVHFAGTVSDVRPWLAAMDAFVLPSREEGSSNAVLEAMAVGRPVVATDVGGMTELIEDGRTGLIVPVADPAALASAMVTVLDAPEHAAALGRAARRVADEAFGAARMVRDMEALWTECLQRAGADVWGVPGEVRSA